MSDQIGMHGHPVFSTVNVAFEDLRRRFESMKAHADPRSSWRLHLDRFDTLTFRESYVRQELDKGRNYIPSERNEEFWSTHHFAFFGVLIVQNQPVTCLVER